MFICLRIRGKRKIICHLNKRPKGNERRNSYKVRWLLPIRVADSIQGVNPETPIKASVPAVIESNTNRGTAVKGFHRCDWCSQWDRIWRIPWWTWPAQETPNNPSFLRLVVEGRDSKCGREEDAEFQVRAQPLTLWVQPHETFSREPS